MIFLKSLLKKAFVIISCGVLFFGVSYAYLHFNFNKNTTDVKRGTYDVPYKRLTENSGILLVLPQKSAVMVYLDFKNSCIRLVDVPVFDEKQTVFNGFPADFTVNTNYMLIEGIIDRVGGVELKLDGKKMRYTSHQAVSLIMQGADSELRKQIFLKIFSQISKADFSKSDFVYIIENSKGNLSIVDCLPWIDHIPNMSKNIEFVN